LLITKFTNKIQLLVQILLIHHILSLTTLQFLKVYDYQSNPITYICQFYSGFYSYYDIINAQINPTIDLTNSAYTSSPFRGMFYSLLQLIVYSIL